MLVSVLLIASAAEEVLKKSSFVTVLNSKNWDSMVEGRSEGATWYVMFYADDCPPCTAVAPEFIQAANRTRGVINFGTVNTTEESDLSRKLDIAHLPTFLFFYSGGHVEIMNVWTADRLLEALAPYFRGCMTTFDPRWLGEPRNSAVLFTANDQVPIFWTLYSCRNRAIRVGYSRDAQLRFQLGAPLAPAAFLVNRTHRQHFREPLDAIRNSDIFFAGKWRKPKVPVTYFLPFELRSECTAPTRLCIASNVAGPPADLERAAEDWGSSTIKFFQGDDDWPTKAIRAGETYLIKPDRNQLYKIRVLKTLGETIQKVLENPDSVTWIRY